MLGPHDGVHGELGAGGPAAEDLDDPLVLVLLQAQFGPGQLDVGVAAAFSTVSRGVRLMR